MKLSDKLTEKLNQNKFTRKLSDYGFRTIIFTVVSLLITTVYAGLYTVLGITLLSAWYGVLACYYLILVIMRATVVFCHRRNVKRGAAAPTQKEEISRAKIYCGCGTVISLLTLPLSAAVLQIVAQKATFSHAGMMIYAAAAYTAYKVAMTVRHLLKARKSADLTVRTVRCINLADTFVSVLALQTAMFNSFAPDGDWGVFNAVTGAVVCLSTVVIGVIMIANGKRAITKIMYEENLKNQRRG